MHGAYQVPHALARHNPGDRPTHDVKQETSNTDTEIQKKILNVLSTEEKSISEIPIISKEIKEETSNADTEMQKETTNVQSTDEESISAIPIISKENDKPRDTKIPQKELHEDEDDSRPMPPDDDSVPDMEDSLIADGVDHEEVEEYININVSNDEDGDISPFEWIPDGSPELLSSKSA